MADLVIVDHSAAIVELLGQRLEAESHTVTGFSDPAEAIAFAAGRSIDPPEVVVVDLMFSQMDLNGLDVMVAFDRRCPESALIVYTSAEALSQSMLRIAWESLRPASAVSKLSPVRCCSRRSKRLPKPEAPRSILFFAHSFQAQHSPWRSAQSYRRLVPHAGHAKLWRSLLENESPPPYKAISEQTRLAVNTIRNYRDDLLGELRLHGLNNPTMQQIHEFAHSVRPLLIPFLDERLEVCGRAR